MNQAVEQWIIAQYPLFERARYPNTSYGYGGFECPSGWTILLAQFAEEVVRLEIQRLVIYQIKEKLNQLRICAECEDEKAGLLDDLVMNIEYASTRVCGRCGDKLTHPHHCIRHEASIIRLTPKLERLIIKYRRTR